MIKPFFHSIYRYCVEFEVIKASKACHKLPPYNKLAEGKISMHFSHICGSSNLVEFFNCLKIIVRVKNEKCWLTTAKINAFRIFSFHYNILGDRVVIRCDLEALQKDTEPEEITDNSSIHNDDDSLPKFRCRGEGLTGRNTRWSALAAPSCRGKWLRLTVGQPKKCTESQFIFI